MGCRRGWVGVGNDLPQRNRDTEKRKDEKEDRGFFMQRLEVAKKRRYKE